MISSNMLGGFYQRFEPSFRRYSFGNINVVGEDKNFDIVGIWMIRGQEIPEEIKEHPQYSVYQFDKLNPQQDAATRKLIEDYWCAEG
jgi:elongation factor 1-gamma